MRYWRRVLLCGLLALPVAAVQALPYANYRALPNSLEMFEAGLYWMRDWFGPENADDPATVLTLMEEQAARHFDFGFMAARIAGPDYWSRDMLYRSHYQRDLRDWLFLRLAEAGGMLDRRPVRYRPIVPMRFGASEYLSGVDILRYGRGRTRLLFHIAWTGRGWRIIDVSLDGQRVTEYLRPRVLPGGAGFVPPQ